MTIYRLVRKPTHHRVLALTAALGLGLSACATDPLRSAPAPAPAPAPALAPTPTAAQTTAGAVPSAPAAPAAPTADPAAIARVLDSVPGVTAAELETRLASPNAPVLLDVRSVAEYAAGHLPGARNLPHDQLAARLADLRAARDQELVVYCRTGRRAAQAIEILQRAGFTRLSHLRGDYQAWSAEGHPVSTPAALPASTAP